MVTLLTPQKELFVPEHKPLIVPGLPTDWVAGKKTMDLSIVPAMPKSDLDPNIPVLQEQWLEWSEQVLRYRLDVWEQTTFKIAGINQADRQALELEKIRRYGPKYFFNVWLSIYEARRNERGLILGGDWKPFILYSFQVMLLDWLDDREASIDEDRNGFISKSRDMGATECCCKRALTKWLFDRPYSAKFISRHEELVDTRGDPDSMFERITPFLDPESEVCLPTFLLPPNWEFAQHRKERLLWRPDNRNTIRGTSSASTAGRGGRAYEAMVDEGSFIPKLRFNVGALFMTCPHTYVVSSESIEVSEDFGEMVDAAKVDCPASVLELDTWLHPFHDVAWQERTRRSYELVGRLDAYYREVLRQREAGLSDFIYPEARQKRPLDTPRAFEWGNKLVAGIDPGLAQDCALGWFELDPVGPTDWCLDGYINHGMIPEWYAAILLGCDPDEQPNHLVGKVSEFDRYFKEEYGHTRTITFDTMQEEYPTWRFGARERELMEWARELPQPILYGDPYGGNQVTQKGEDWYTRMLIFSRKYNPRMDDRDGRGKALVVVKNWTQDAREHQTRQNALNTWLARLEFAGTRGARQIHHAIAQSKFQNKGFGRVSEQVIPEHDDYSHPRTMAEYVAVSQETIRISGRGHGLDVVRSERTRREKTRVRVSVDQFGPFAKAPRS
jgi:hypothetical protein